MGFVWTSLRMRAPLECDRRLLLTSAIDEVRPLLSSPGSVAGWFGGLRRTTMPDGQVSLRLSGSDVVVSGHDRWHPDVDAVAFQSDDVAVTAFLTLRAAMLPDGGVGTELWIHVELPPTRRGRRILAALLPAVEAGLARMQAELDRS